MITGFFPKDGRFFGYQVIISPVLPKEKFYYKKLWPVIGGHIWIDAVEKTDTIVIMGNEIHVTQEIWDNINQYDSMITETIDELEAIGGGAMMDELQEIREQIADAIENDNKYVDLDTKSSLYLLDKIDADAKLLAEGREIVEGESGYLKENYVDFNGAHDGKYYSRDTVVRLQRIREWLKKVQ